MSNQVRIDASELDRIAKRLGVNTEAVIRKIAFEVEGAAKMEAPLETGALKNSIYTVTSKFDGYSKAASRAKSANPEAETDPLPQPAEGSAYVGPCVNYGIYLEYGTSRMAAQPFLGPAAEAVAQKYNDGSAWQELVK